jgi:hypothetical protein
MKQFRERSEIERRLIAKGVENLMEFGYQSVSVDNIMTDDPFKSFFRSMLNDNLGHSNEIDQAIESLLADL